MLEIGAGFETMSCQRKEPETRLRIAVVSAVGHGRTPLSAFDDALYAVGVHGYNLIILSSVIPTAAEVVEADRYDAPDDHYGHKLFVVRAEARSAVPGAVAAAGLGWLHGADGAGVFVEHHAVATAGSRAALEDELAADIVASLSDLATRRNLGFAPDRVRSRIVSASVTSGPVCALVLACYQAEGWHQSGSRSGRERG